MNALDGFRRSMREWWEYDAGDGVLPRKGARGVVLVRNSVVQDGISP